MNARTIRMLVICAALSALAPAAMPQGSAEPVRLALSECLRTALRNNLDLVSARTGPQVAEQAVVQRDAEFDFNLTGSYSHDEAILEPRTLTQASDSTIDSADVGVTQKLLFGGDYTLGFSTRRTNQTGGFSIAETTYESGLDLRITVPLLRGRGVEATTEQLMLARGDLEISREQLRAQAHSVLEAVEGAYWNVVAAIEAVRTERLALQRADDLLTLNRKKVEVGTLAPIEITQAEAGVASQQEGVIVAETVLADAEDELRRLLAIPPDDPMWGQPIQPTDRPGFERVAIDLDSALATAIDSRPEVEEARLALRNRELSQRAARSAIRHGLDLDARFAPAGNKFTNVRPPDPDDPTIPTIPEEEIGATVDSIQEIPDLDTYAWSLGLNYSYAIGNRASDAGYKIATINRDRAEVDLRNQEQSVRVEVRAAVRGVESGYKRFEAARKNVELQREKLEAEQKKFENGMSTSFEVLTFQNDLADAELGLIRAALDYVKSLTAVERAKGTLLEARGLTLDAS